MSLSNDHLDARDHEIVAAAQAGRDQYQGPRIGDFVLFPTGELERFCQSLHDSLQTAPGGSFYLHSGGSSSFSGGLNPPTKKKALELTTASLPGRFWFFHHGVSGAGRGVDCDIPCRVYKTSEPYTGYLGSDFQSKLLQEQKRELAAKLAKTEAPTMSVFERTSDAYLAAHKAASAALKAGHIRSYSCTHTRENGRQIFLETEQGWNPEPMYEDIPSEDRAGESTFL